MSPSNTDLRKFINQFFSDEELETFCFDYFREVSDDFGSGMSKNRKAMRLIAYCESRGVLDNLWANLKKERPTPWREQFGAKAVVVQPAIVQAGSVPDHEREPRQVFISHAKEDAEFARQLAADLREEGWRVWIAPDSIRPGEKWVEAINRGLETSGVFVVALTPAAVASRWVNFETNAAIDMHQEEEIRLVTLDVVACRLPVLWRQLQYVTFRNSYETGLDKLLHWLDGEPVAVEAGLRPTPTPSIQVKEREAKPSQPAADPDRRVHAKTGIEFIRIPAGPFLYGSADSDEIASDDEKPQRTIDLPEYWIGRYPVTNAQFARFIQAVGYKTTAESKGDGWGWTGSEWDQIKGADWRHPRGPKSSIDGKDDHPVVQVSWDDAKAFCDWAGLVLPSEEQWEKAARGADGRCWPWGNEPPTDQYCNFNMNVKDTTPVGRYLPLGDSPYGCADMAGNVWEWTGSWFDTQQTRRVVRGGSWFFNQYIARAAIRLNPRPNNRIAAFSVSGWCAGPHLRRSELCRRASGSGARLA
jgi:formylglycine-generating enzyme